MNRQLISIMKVVLGGMLVIGLLGWSNEKKQAQDLTLNQIQVIGSHNSYKQPIEAPLMKFMVANDPKAIGLEYGHLPIEAQLDLGLRGLELDVLYDPKGGRYTKPKGLELMQMQGVKTEPFDTSDLTAPGFKVLHVPDVDFRTHCGTFKGCLSTIRKWSEHHNNHLPIIITINPKTSGLDLPGFTKVLPFDEEVLDSLDQEIHAILGPEKLITPNLVKGRFPTLKEAILTKGWPKLTNARGKILFVLDAGQQITEQYIKNQEANRPMFVHVDKTHPQAGFFIMNNPIKQEQEIQELVKKGFMVRTRSDANTQEARSGDTSRFKAAIRCGAQLISTDYYQKSLSPDKTFEIVFDNQSYTQCNPLLMKESACKL